jgi:hypothetical protein
MAKKATTKKAAPEAPAKKKVTLTVAKKATPVKATKKDAPEASTRGRKTGTIGFKWVKAPKEPWPSALECNIMDACEAVEQGTSGDVTAFALKHGLGDLTKQIPNKVVTHVMVKLRNAGIIAATAPAKAEKKVAKTAAPAAPPAKKVRKTAKAKAKKSRVVMEAPPAVAQDASPDA